MYRFSDRSIGHLNTCHEDLITLFTEVIKHRDCSVLCGYRDQVAQDAAFKSGMSKVEYPNSQHNVYRAMACDVVPYPIDWKDLNRFNYFAGFVLGIATRMRHCGIISHEVRWGGDWDNDGHTSDHTFTDCPHFYIVSKK